MELRQLEAFVAVAEELHFGRAAQRLHLAQSPLSQRVLRLERELGVRLFERSNRRVELSDAGRLLLPQARAALERATALADLARRWADGRAGTLRLGYVASAAFSVLPALLRALRAESGVQVELTRLRTAAQLEALAAGELDAGIARAVPHGGGIAVRRLGPDPLLAVVPSGRGLTPPLDLRALASEDWVLTGGGIDEAVLASCAAAGFTPRVAHRAPDLPTLVGLVAGGLGVSLVPASVAAMRPEGADVLAVAGGGGLELTLIWTSARTTPSLARLVAVASRVLWTPPPSEPTSPSSTGSPI
jgi:DNA-binding transcriptional LysR family regulator